MSSDERAIRVGADDVTLRLTLSAKLQKKPFADAVLTPFIKAFNKKKGTEWTVNDLVSVTVEDDLVTDYSVPASVVLLSNETVDAKLCFSQQQKREMLLDSDPFSGQKWEAPKGGDVDFIADEDDRSEVEKLKAKRREARLAKEAEAGGSATAAAAAVPAEPPPPPPPPPAAVREAGGESSADGVVVLKALSATEEAVSRLGTEAISLSGVCVIATGPEAEEAKKRLASLSAEVGALIQSMDDVTFAGLAEDARELARARKKEVVATLEGWLLPEVTRMQKQLAASGGGVASLPASAAAVEPTKSAEIDSDED